MILANEFYLQSKASIEKSKYGVKYIERQYKTSLGATFNYLSFVDEKYTKINHLILDLMYNFYTNYRDFENIKIKISFTGVGLGLLSLLLNAKTDNAVMIKGINFLTPENQLFSPSLFLEELKLTKKGLKKIIKTRLVKTTPIYDTLHISNKEVAIFCLNPQNDGLSLIKVKMLE